MVEGFRVWRFRVLGIQVEVFRVYGSKCPRQGQFIDFQARGRYHL